MLGWLTGTLGKWDHQDQGRTELQLVGSYLEVRNKERILRASWTIRRSNPSILKEISPEYSLEADAKAEDAPTLWPPGVKN